MWRPFSQRMSVAAAVASTAALAMSAEAAVAAPFHLELDAGTACTFGLAVDGAGGDRRVERTFVDADGNTVRMLSAGRGYQLTLTNLSNDASLALPANGAVMRTVFNADGSQTVTSTGHNVLILFPSDVPAGPSTTLYVGRVVYTVDADGVFTLQSTRGKATDICAALS
jgi:uncharacterized membrane protein